KIIERSQRGERAVGCYPEHGAVVFRPAVLRYPVETAVGTLNQRTVGISIETIQFDQCGQCPVGCHAKPRASAVRSAKESSAKKLAVRGLDQSGIGSGA